MFKILILAAFCPQKKQNNAACAAEKSGFKVKDRWIKTDVDLASHDTSHAPLRSLENQANSRIKKLFLESCQQIYCAASGKFKLKALCIK